MQFGFTLKPESTLERTVALTQQAEAAGFTARAGCSTPTSCGGIRTRS